MKCQGTTNAGNPCQGGAQKGTRFCGPHQDQAYSAPAPVDTLTIEEMDEWFKADMEHKYDFIVSGTGSRSLQTKNDTHKKEILDRLVNEFNRLKDKYGNVLVITGMAEGFDTAIARAAQITGLDYVAAIPSPSYGNYYWQNNSVTGYNRIEEFNDYLDKAVQVVYVCDNHKYGKANFIRNEYMVNLADAFYVYNKTSRGTSHCVSLIERADKPYIEVG